MTPERWKRIEDLFHAASALPPGAHQAYLAGACPDEALRRDVEQLLKDSASDDGFLARRPQVTALLASGAAFGAITTQRIGSYHLDALLGVGGMGEVYRAHDTKLQRDVAIKILPAGWASDAGRLARLEREARMLAALNHPNVCGIYGLEEADGIRFLVLELVDGETLAQTLRARFESAGTGLPLGDALRIARQIIDALDAAHERGMVHRDLKPANIKITPDGTVKVLDFGLAKTVSGDRSTPDLSNAPIENGGRREGGIVGTPAYMSPEQARGLSVDTRTDIWTFGCVLYEMLTGRAIFAGDTASDSIARILERDPEWSALPATTPAPIRRLLLRCLVKDPKRRLRDIGDAAIEIDAIGEVLPGESATQVAHATSPTWLPWTAVLALTAAVGIWEAQRPAAPWPNPLAGATFARLTNWEGTEEHADISPDGKWVAFLADKAGELDVWASQIGTGHFENLTLNNEPMMTPGNLLRSLGFSDDGTEIWFNRQGNPGKAKVLIPLTGVGTPRPFLGDNLSTPSWSAEGRLAYIVSNGIGDPLFTADRTGADARPLVPLQQKGEKPFFREKVHTHNPVWSQDGRWIYFVHGMESTGEMDVWRIQPSGASPERLTHLNAPVNFLAPIDSRTLLYVARADDWSGPWLWALDVETKETRRVTVGLEQYVSVAASRDGRRVVATVAHPTANLWRLPMLDRLVEDSDVEPYKDTPTERALAPRLAGTSLFYLSLNSRGTGDGLWRLQDGQTFEVRKGAEDVLSEPPAPSPDGSQVVVVVRHQGKQRLALMSADGTNSRTLAPSLDVRSIDARGAADWSPDGKWIAAGGDDGQGSGLFKIPVDGGNPVRLVAGEAVNPAWSPKGDLIVYAAARSSGEPLIPNGRHMLRGVRSDGTRVALPEVQVPRGGGHRFLRNGMGIVYLTNIESTDFWLVDLATNKLRPLTHLSDRGTLNTFDMTPDGKYIVFDRSRQNSDVVLIDRPAK